MNGLLAFLKDPNDREDSKIKERSILEIYVGYKILKYLLKRDSLFRINNCTRKAYSLEK